MTLTLWLTALQILALLVLAAATVGQIRATRRLNRTHLHVCQVLVRMAEERWDRDEVDEEK